MDNSEIRSSVVREIDGRVSILLAFPNSNLGGLLADLLKYELTDKDEDARLEMAHEFMVREAAPLSLADAEMIIMKLASAIELAKSIETARAEGVGFHTVDCDCR